MKRKLVVAATAATVVSASLWLFAATVPQDPPIILPYRGYLEKIGQPVNRQVDVTVEIFDGAQSVWQDFFDAAHGNAIQVANGNLGILLGSHKALGPELLVGGHPLDLQITVDGTVLGKQRLHPVAYAVSSANAHHASQEFSVDGGLSANQLTLSGTATIGGTLQAGGVVTPTISSGDAGVQVEPSLTVPRTLSVGGVASAHEFAPQFDSGWFIVTSNSGDITKAHTLGQVPSHFTVLQCGWSVIPPADPFTSACSTRVIVGSGAGEQINPVDTEWDSSNYYLHITSGRSVWNYWDNASGWTCKSLLCSAGYYRVLAWR